MPKKLVLALCALCLVTTAPALADDHRRGGGRHWQQGDDDGRHGPQIAHGNPHKQKKHHKHRKHHKAKEQHHRVVWHGEHHRHPRRHGHVRAPGRGLGYGHSHGHHHAVRRHHSERHRGHDDWALYAVLALQIVDVLNESQRDSFAWAQRKAAAAPLGETITWHDGGARGSVVPLRDGSDTGGRYCREFQQEVVVGGRRQSAYGIACRQPDGAWQMVSN